MPRSLLAILYKDETTWMSCSKIHRGLIEVYQKDNHVDLLFLENSVLDFKKMEQALSNKHYDAIVGIDHRLSPSKILNYLKDNPKLKEEIKKTKILFHTFKEIEQLKADWTLFHSLAMGLDVHLIVPCQSQYDVYHKYLLSPTNLHLLPCMIDSEFGRLITSFPHNLYKGGPIKIGYAGRISRLKNIIPMIDLFLPYLNSNRMELHLTGPFDDYDQNDITRGIGYYMNDVLNKIKTTSNVYYHGVKTSDDELCQFLSGLDGFCTLSTQKGEDFCFAVAEALHFGLPCLINKWMGLIDHAQRNKRAHIVDFKAQRNGEIDPTSIDKDEIDLFLKLCAGDAESRNFIRETGQFAKVSRILSQPSSPFEGFQIEMIKAL
jgi:glycosyltransferase involved in cell wall biosynthesis